MLERFAQQPFGGRGRQRCRPDPGRAQPLQLALQPFPLQQERRPTPVVDQAQRVPSLRQTQISVVLPQLEPKFRPAGKHAVWLGHAFAHQIVNQHTQVGLVAARQPRVAARHLQCGIGASKQPLRRCFLVARRAVDLPGKEQSADSPCLQIRLQLAGIEVVVFDGVPRPQNVRTLQAHHRPHGSQLHIEGQRRRDTVRINLVRIQPFRLQKNLVTRLVSKPINLVLDARAVARSDAVNQTREHRAAVETALDDLVRSLIGMRDPARQLPWMHQGIAQEAENRHGVGIPRLLDQPREVNRAPVQPRRRARLQPPLPQLQLFQPCRQAQSRRIAGAPSAVILQPDMDAAVEKGAGRQHDGAGSKLQAQLGHRTDHPVTFQHQVVHRLLKQPQVLLVLQSATNRRAVQHAVSLRTRSPNCRPLAAVKNAELDTRFVGGSGHRAAQRVDLLDQVALANATDRRVAAHLAQRLDVVRQQQRFAPHARRGQRRFGAGVPAPDDDHIKMLRMFHDAAILGGSLHGAPVRRATSAVTLSATAAAPRR